MKKPTNEQWQFIMKLILENPHNPIYIGDEFGEYFFEEFLNCLPPLINGVDYVLCSNLHSTVLDVEIFIGIYGNHNTWFGITTDKQDFLEIIKSRKDWNNPNRTRYYGLCIGDKVQVKFGTKIQYGIVNNFDFTDNNRVQLQMEDGTLSTWVAEHCKRIESKEIEIESQH